jgi:hypothetical protein
MGGAAAASVTPAPYAEAWEGALPDLPAEVRQALAGTAFESFLGSDPISRYDGRGGWTSRSARSSRSGSATPWRGSASGSRSWHAA